MRQKSQLPQTKPTLGSGPRNYNWYLSLKKSSLTPPQWVFPVVWTILYILIAISGYKYFTTTNFQPQFGMYVYFVQIVLNLIWSPLFFWKKWIITAFLDILVLTTCVYMNVLLFSLKNQTAGLLLVPYALWLTLATYLNGYIAFNNFAELQFQNLRQMEKPYQEQEAWKKHFGQNNQHQSQGQVQRQTQQQKKQL